MAARICDGRRDGMLPPMPVDRLLPDQDAADLIALTRDIADKVLTPIVDEHERSETYPEGVFAQLGAAGLLSLAQPEEWGGAGQPFEVYLQVLEELAAHGLQEIVAGHLRQGGVGHQQVAQDGGGTGDQEDPEHQQRQFWRVELCLRLFGDHVVGGAHEAEQQPDDQEVGVDHPRDVERDGGEQEVTDDVLQAHDEPEQHLSGEESDGGDEVWLRDRLRGILHGLGPFLIGNQPSMLGGQFAVLISDMYFRNSTRSFSCCSVRWKLGIWRRPGAPVG